MELMNLYKVAWIFAFAQSLIVFTLKDNKYWQGEV